jgi:hypothetical protein
MKSAVIPVTMSGLATKTTFLGKSRSVVSECGTLSKDWEMDGFYLDMKKWWIKSLTPLTG